MIPAWAIRTEADREAIKQGCYWDAAKADAIVNFAESIFKPQYIAGKFELLRWQRRFLMSLYGWRAPNGTRRFRTANLHISKKQGKTLLVSIISGFELLQSDSPSPFVVTGSVSKENASQVFNELKHTVTKTFGTKAKKYLKVTANQKKIVVPSLNSEYRALASDGDTAQGYNVSTCVVDEGHAHKNAGLYDSLRYSTIARPDGLLIVISTAGDDVCHWYYGQYQKSKRILAGEDLDISHYAEVYEADADCNIEDPAQWAKANPSLGTSFTEEQFRLDLEAARQDPAELNRWKRYRLNLWIRPDELAYFDVALFDRGKQIIPDEQLRKADCNLAVDLSQTTDPSSVSACWALPGGRFFVRSWAWVCDQGVRDRDLSNLPKYQQFAAEGSMQITPGDRIDDKRIYHHLLDLTKQYRVKSVTFDPSSAMMLMALLEEEGVKVQRMPQTHRYYSAPMKEFNRLIHEAKILHGGESWLRYCLANVRIDEDRQGNIRPAKKRSIDKIDGAISALMAFSQSAQQPADARKSRYDTEGIFYV